MGCYARGEDARDTSRTKGAQKGWHQYSFFGLSSPGVCEQLLFPCPELCCDTEVHLVVFEIFHLSPQLVQKSQQEDWP